MDPLGPRQTGDDGFGFKIFATASRIAPKNGRRLDLSSLWSNLEDGRQWIEAFSGELKPPALVLFSGEMGAGKTQSVRWLVEALGGDARQVASPTFSIHHRYQTTRGPVDHVDLYRLSSDRDLESSGFWDLLNAEKGLVIVEWADRLPEDVWPKNWSRHFIHIEKDGQNLRRVSRRDF